MARCTTTENNPFPRWLAESGLSVRKAAQVLGCSTHGVMTWKKVRPPLYVLLACAAVSNGQEPIRYRP